MLTVLFLIFITLKLTGTANISWFVVFVPLMLDVVVSLFRIMIDIIKEL